MTVSGHVILLLESSTGVAGPMLRVSSAARSCGGFLFLQDSIRLDSADSSSVEGSNHAAYIYNATQGYHVRRVSQEKAKGRTSQLVLQVKLY